MTKPAVCTSLHWKQEALDPSEEKHLSLDSYMSHSDKMQAAYSKLMECKSNNMAGKMCWPTDWFPEPLPMENSAGTAMQYALEYEANPDSTIDGQFPPIDQGVAPPLDILCFPDSFGYCTEMFAQAPPGRIGTLNVQNKPLSSYDEKGINQLIKAANWDLLIFAPGVDPAPEKTVKSVHDTQDAVMKVFLWLVKAISDNEGQVKKVAVLTVDTFAEEPEIHEEMGLALITHATLFGMTNTARHEIPMCPFQYIDTEWALLSENTKFLAAEIFRESSFGHNTVRILNKGRYVLRAVDGTKYEHNQVFKIPDDGVICITGGNGGLGLVMGTWILRQCEMEGPKRNLSIEFLSRTGRIKNDEDQPNWQECMSLSSKLGITVQQVVVDVSKEEKAHQYIKEKRGRLKGVIHSAGVLQDGMLFNMNWEKFDKCFDAKSRAALYLHDALQQHENPIEFFWLFSSQSVYGNMGQLNYSGSNAMLDALVRHRRALGLPGMAPQWGAWGDVGMARNLDDPSRRRMAASPFPYFSNAEGLQGLDQLIKTNLPHAQIMRCNAPLVFGLIMGDDSVPQCYTRNFWSQIAPPPPGDPYKNPYTAYTYEYRSKSHKLKNALSIKHNCGPIWKEYEMDEL